MLGAALGANGWTVTVAALITALATGLGAAPLLFGRLARSLVGISNAAAAGFMLAASGMLFYEGGVSGVARTAIGAAVGVLVIHLAVRRVNAHEHVRFAALRGADARKALIIVAVMTVHSAAEGIGVGVAFGPGESIGLVTALAIAVHNIPEGLAISLVLVPRGVSVLRASGWSVFSSLPQPLLALPAFVFVESFGGFLPAGLGFAGGAMAWLVVAEIIPDALRVARPTRVVVSLASAAVLFAALEIALLAR